jgi:hypothetical protein
MIAVGKFNFHNVYRNIDYENLCDKFHFDTFSI